MKGYRHTIAILVFLIGGAVPVLAGDSLSVILEAKKFAPGVATVKDGDSITICNRDPFIHLPFSYSRYNKFGNPKGIRLAPGACTTQVAHNPTAKSIVWQIRDELHSGEALNVTILSSGSRGVSGSWRITQTGNGANYGGTLRISESSGKISGSAEWDNHSRGAITGYIEGDKIWFTISYGEGLIGTYEATLNIEGGRMANGTARSNKGGAAVSWYASLQ